jgi:hypothetical protein
MVQLVSGFTVLHVAYDNIFTSSRATKILASKGFYVCLILVKSSQFLNYQCRSSGTGLIQLRGIRLVVLLEELFIPA